MTERISSVNYGEGDWNRFYEQKGDSWRDKDYRKLYHLFALESLKGSVADIGCGLGDGLLFLKRKISRASDFYGFDFAGEIIARNNENPALKGIEFHRKDIHEPFEKRFDNIICLQTIEHLTDPKKAMHNMIEAASSVLIVGAPYKNRRPDEDHVWSFDENDFKNDFDFIRIDDDCKNIYWVRGPNGLNRGYLSKFMAKILS